MIGIGFFAAGLVGLLLVGLLAPQELCFASCTSRYEDILVRYAVRAYGLISIGIGSLFVLIGAFGNAVRSSWN
jgi:hypothetical protein